MLPRRRQGHSAVGWDQWGEISVGARFSTRLRERDPVDKLVPVAKAGRQPTRVEVR